MIKINLFEKLDLSGYTFLEGFPGAGLVGPMAISYIIEKLAMKYVGYVDSDRFPPLIAIHGERPLPAVRVYAYDKAKVITILAEFAIPIDLTYEMVEQIYGFIKANGISKIVSIGGIPSQQQDLDQQAVFAIASTDALKKEAQKAGLREVGEGVATGINAMLMLKTTMDGVQDISILVPVDPNILDPKYAELAILSLNKLINLNVDIKELDKEAKEVEAKIKEVLKKNREIQEAHKKAVGDDTGPSMYA
jgi:uncharacterized protein